MLDILSYDCNFYRHSLSYIFSIYVASSDFTISRIADVCSQKLFIKTIFFKNVNELYN